MTQAENSGRFRLSLVAPMYNEEEVLGVFFEHVEPILNDLTPDWEVICVNDGSSDRTLELLQVHHVREPRIAIVDLSRNFGKELALTAGLDHASGDAIIPIDCDLQDPPELIPRMVDLWLEGNDVVLAVRSNRDTDTPAKRITANLFYHIMGRIGEVEVPANAGDFRLMDRQVVEAVKRLPERTRFMKGLFAWLGFRQTTVTYSRQERAAGQSKWKYWRLWNFALEGIFSFSTLPLRIWSYLGILIASATAIYMLFIVGLVLTTGVDVPGYASLLIIVLFFSGLNMIGLGILGEYLGRVFIEVKQRPLYLVRETMGIQSPDRGRR